MEASRIEDTVRSIAGPSARIVAVCGELVGQAYFGPEDGWTIDKVDGQLAVTVSPEGQYDLIFSSGIMGFVSAIQDGGQVIRVEHSGDELVLLAQHRGGVAESYVFSGAGDEGQAISVSVKPSTGPLPARGRAFVAHCHFPSL